MIRVIDRKMLRPLKNYFEQYEYKSVSLSSRMVRKGLPAVPSPDTASVICQVDGNRELSIKNLIMVTAGGILLPMFSDNPPDPSSLNEMLEKVFEYKRRIFCVLGTGPDAELVRENINRAPAYSIDYYLFTAEPRILGRQSIPEIEILRAGKRDDRILYDLEEAYLLEEVIHDRSAYSSTAARMNLRRTCSLQTVYYAAVRGKPVAKVNTNATGLYWNQIGGVYTKPEYRNKGISAILMDYLLDSIYRDRKKAVLYVRKDNQPALALYRKLQFMQTGEYTAIYMNP